MHVQPLESVYEDDDGEGAGSAGLAGGAGSVVREDVEGVMVMAAQFMLNSCSRLYQVLLARLPLACFASYTRSKIDGGLEGWGQDSPRKDDVPGRNVGRDGEVEGLAVGAFAAVAVRAVAWVGGGDLEGLAGVDGEADLAGAAPVVAYASQAVQYEH